MPLWLYWILLGLVAGALAKFLVPGRDPSGCIITIVLGIAGAFIGGWLGTFFGWGRVTGGTFNLRSIGIATVGAAVLLVVGRLVVGRRRRE
ncbi:MAG TPA: GlsB/YeaQ/YmgE family stress response membrane protein [Gemmatimonadaceae bacterium]|nr:GlsB/YeaQ/YmgE family stress response membrane protein [Gemmatimonadaceae bacterium]